MTINEVASKMQISQDTLRYYEKDGLFGPVKRTENGYRYYQEHDLRRIEFIKCMRDAGISILTLKRYIQLFELGDATKEERKELLIQEKEKLKQQIEAMNKALDRLDKKINLYYEDKLDEYFEVTKEKK